MNKRITNHQAFTTIYKRTGTQGAPQVCFRYICDHNTVRLNVFSSCLMFVSHTSSIQWQKCSKTNDFPLVVVEQITRTCGTQVRSASLCCVEQTTTEDRGQRAEDRAQRTAIDHHIPISDTNAGYTCQMQMSDTNVRYKYQMYMSFIDWTMGGDRSKCNLDCFFNSCWVLLCGQLHKHPACRP